ncbi:peptidoglycan-binding protein [Parvularcula sp. ZS-1/3]|uniref:Peptidoglycan-binding protein n=1 Tax=Parvularcula mediterranea TaxID=2732508 RepID=A0A7Y3RKP4_9PROT|nr:peptidoglycan-binding domain-containing protein [Parvularcula mediterranea]NNU15326.1 peptidoglycan-binding protein [Parvularcula mediterranea]
MSIKRTLAAAAAILPMLAAGAQAGDADGRYAVKGIGLLPCKNFIEMAEGNKPEASLVMAWFTGYLSAANMLVDETYDFVSWQGDALLVNALAGMCSQMPDQPVAMAATQVVNGLGRERIQKAEQPKVIKVGEQQRYLYPTVVRRMQSALKERGQSVTVDGDFGPGSQSALRAFQKQVGVPETGFPDAISLYALFSPQQAGQAQQPRPQAQAQQPRTSVPTPLAPIDMEPVKPALGGGN